MTPIRIILTSLELSALLNLTTLILLQWISHAAIGLILISSSLLLLIGLIYLVARNNSKQKKGFLLVSILSGSINLGIWITILIDIGAAF